jgi:transposase
MLEPDFSRNPSSWDAPGSKVVPMMSPFSLMFLAWVLPWPFRGLKLNVFTVYLAVAADALVASWPPPTAPASANVHASDVARTLRALGITPVIARRGTEHGSGLGRERWVVERGFAHLHNFRRLRIRYERDPDMHTAFLTLACSILCWRRLQSL